MTDLMVSKSNPDQEVTSSNEHGVIRQLFKSYYERNDISTNDCIPSVEF